MSDYDEIRNLIASYALTAHDQKFEEFADNFAEDGELVELGRSIPKSALINLQKLSVEAKKKLPQPNGSKHIQVNTVIRIDGETARAVTDLVSIRLAPATGWTIGGTGRYDDDLVKTDGRWLFRRREVTWYDNLPSHLDDPQYGNRLVAMIEEAVR